MSGHADTIRANILGQPTKKSIEALDALLAENQRYERALKEIGTFSPTENVSVAASIAREALAGDAE